MSAVGELRPASASEFAGLVAEEGGFDEGADDGLFVGVELVEGGEVVAEVGGELIVVVGEGVDACGEVVGDAAQGTREPPANPVRFTGFFHVEDGRVTIVTVFPPTRFIVPSKRTRSEAAIEVEVPSQS